jgi:BED zinc finger
MATSLSKSPVWKSFKVDSADTKKAVCNECNARISRGRTSAKTFTTTNLIAHLRSRHAVRYREFEAELSSKGSATSTPSPASVSGLSKVAVETSVQPTLQQCASMKEVWPIDHPRAQAISAAIGEMMALDCQPFSVVEDEGFRRLMNLVAPRYSLPSRRYFYDNVLTDMHERLRVKVGEALASSCEFLALTTDEWSADNAPGVALLSLTAHWIDEKFNRRYAMLHAQNLEAAHTGDYLAQVTTEMLAGWHLRKDRVQCLAWQCCCDGKGNDGCKHATYWVHGTYTATCSKRCTASAERR